MNAAVRTREISGLNEPRTVRSHWLVTSVRVKQMGGHEAVVIFVRGGNAGTIWVDVGDGERLAERLIPGGVWVSEEDAS